MTTAQDVLRIARAELGVKEHPANSNKTKYGRWYGMNGEPWCAMFVSYCFNFAGLPLPITLAKGFAYCPYGVNWFKQQNRLYTTPKVGDVVFFDWAGGRNGAEHVGIVEKVISDQHIVAIEGNTSKTNQNNGGQVMRRDRENCMLGYGRPDYSGVSVFGNTKLSSWSGRYVKLTPQAMKGNDIQAWQTRMVNLGWTLGTDGSSGKGDNGVFGKSSRQALLEFQKVNGLEVDGILGPASFYKSFMVDAGKSESVFVPQPLGGDEVKKPENVQKVHPQGIWIWRLNKIRTDYLDALVNAKCRRVYLKVLDDASAGIFWDDQCNAETIAKFAKRGMEVWGWGYIFDRRTTTDTTAILAAIRKAFDAGIQGFVFDVEKEVENSATHDQLKEILVRARSIIPTGCMGYTSFGNPRFHPEVPWQLLNQVCDLQFPQIYYELFTFGPGAPSAAENKCEVEICLQEHRELGLDKPILPIWASEPGAPHPTSRKELQHYLNAYPGSSVWRATGAGETSQVWNCTYDSQAVPAPPAPASELLYRAKVNDPNPPLNVRSGPGTNFAILARLEQGTALSVKADNNAGWLQITEPAEGWVAKHLTQRLRTTGEKRPVLHLARQNRRDRYGLETLYLSIRNGDFNPIDGISVTSGQPNNLQKFELGSPQNVPGCLYPLPQGEYSVGTVEWANGVGNHKASWGEGLGPVWVAINPHFETRRGGFGFHLDANCPPCPGSAGCVVFRTISDLKKFVRWFADPELAPKHLVVDWGLGSRIHAMANEAALVR